jgi:aspartyl-tRNA(Asn)/glutamyl-tRNA(Gln) amidotransferase subunit C
VQKIAHLARLSFSPAEEEALVADLGKIIGWMDKLSELDTAGVEPLIHISAELNVLRDDVPEPPLSHQQALLNAPRKDSDYFRVPKVIE